MLALAPAAAGDEIEALAREKAEAVSLLKTKAAKKVAQFSADRIFSAYLNSSTQGQGARLRTRMAAMFATLWNRYGVREVTLVDRAGELVVRLGAPKGASGSVDVKTDPVFQAAAAQKPRTTAMLAAGDALIHAAPVVVRDQVEFVLSARQDIAAYRVAIARGVPDSRFVTLVDAKGAIVADTRRDVAPGGRKLVAGLALDGLKRALKGKDAAGSGEIERGLERYRLSYQAAGEWTVVAGEKIAPPRRCTVGGQRLCG